MLGAVVGYIVFNYAVVAHYRIYSMGFEFIQCHWRAFKTLDQGASFALQFGHGFIASGASLHANLECFQVC